MSDLTNLADLLDSCEPEDDQPVTWGALRRQVRKASEHRGCACNADAYSLNSAEVLVHSPDGCYMAPAFG